MAAREIAFKRPRVFTRPPSQSDELKRFSLSQVQQDREFENADVVNLDRLEAILRGFDDELFALKARVFGSDLQQIVGVSYYGGAHAPLARMQSDLTALAAKNYNNVRVWATWSDPFSGVTQADHSPILVDGSVNSGPMGKLLALVDYARGLGMTVDITISHAKLTDPTSFRDALEGIHAAIGGLDNWFIDVDNEHESTFLTQEQSGILLGIQNTLDDGAHSRTMSLSGSVNAMGSRYRDELALNFKYSFLTPHFPRTSTWAEDIPANMSEFRSALGGQGEFLGVHLQEETRRARAGEGVPWYEPTAATEYELAALSARQSGARGFVFHTGAAYDLRSASLIDQLDATETTALDLVPAAWFGA